MTHCPVVAWIGLGSNLQNPEQQLTQALTELNNAALLSVIAHSALYRTPPMGPADQPDYINAVAMVETTLPPESMLDTLQAIESQHGRIRDGEQWGPRTLDLDLLLYADLSISSERLTVPHPGIGLRNFVLYPMREISPTMDIPGLGPISDVIQQLDQDPPTPHPD
jgi:2-amino-4-hydroxy-6-hydroxymethyldihydropteridine diphosphokinase